MKRLETGGRKKAKVFRTERTTETGMRRRVSGSLDTSLGGRGANALRKGLLPESVVREKREWERSFLISQYRFFDNNVSYFVSPWFSLSLVFPSLCLSVSASTPLSLCAPPPPHSPHTLSFCSPCCICLFYLNCLASLSLSLCDTPPACSINAQTKIDFVEGIYIRSPIKQNQR